MSDPSPAAEDDQRLAKTDTGPNSLQDPSPTRSAEIEADASKKSGRFAARWHAAVAWFIQRWWLTAAAIATGGTGALLSVAALVVSTPIAPGQGTVLGGLGVLAAGGLTYYGTHRTRLSNERIALDTKTQAENELEHERKKLTTTNERDDTKAERTEKREQERALRARFTASAAQLADPSPTIRLAGVFSLKSLAEDWAAFDNLDEKNVCIELLRSYLVSPQIAPPPDAEDAPPFLAVRAQIVQVLHAEQRTRPRSFSGLLTSAKLARVDLTRIDLTGAKLNAADLTRANLTGATLINANLTGATLINAKLTNANLTNANLARADLTNATLIAAILSGADIPIANLTDANLTAAKLDGARLTSSKLNAADLTNAKLTNAKLTRADFTGANLTNSNLTNSNLIGADLTGANLTGANLTGANLTNAVGTDD